MRKFLTFLSVSILSLASIFLFNGVADAVSPDFTWVSLNSSGQFSTGGSSGSAVEGMSSNGQFVLFRSDATNLGQTDGQFHLYLWNSSTASSQEIPVSGNVPSGSLSSDGNVVLYYSSNDDHVYAYNISTTTTTYVCQSCGNGILSGDGNYVLYNNGGIISDSNIGISILNISTGSRTEVPGVSGSSPLAAGPIGINSDGSKVLFSGQGQGYASGYGSDGRVHLYEYDPSSGITNPVDSNSSGDQSNASSATGPQGISNDGNYIIFYSDASNLVSGARTDFAQVYLKNMSTGSVTLVSSGTSSNGVNQQAYPSGVSNNGNLVAFSTGATDVTPDTPSYRTNGFIINLTSGVVTTLPGIGSLDLSADGSYAAFQTDPELYDSTQPDSNQVAEQNLNPEYNISGNVTYYTQNDGTTFSRSTTPPSSGVSTQTNNPDGSVTVSVNSSSGYADSGFTVYHGTLGSLPNFTASGTGAEFGLNLWFDTNNDGSFFQWNSSGNLTSLGGDTYGLSSGSSGNTLSVSSSTNFYMMDNGQNYTLAQLIAGDDTASGITSTTPVTVWIGVDVGSGSASATITSISGLF